MEYPFKVACRIQIWKETFCQNNDKLNAVLLKMTLCFIYIYTLYLQKNVIH